MHNRNGCKLYQIAEDIDVLLAIVDFFSSQTQLCESFQLDIFYNTLAFSDSEIKQRWTKDNLLVHITDFIDNNCYLGEMTDL